MDAKAYLIEQWKKTLQLTAAEVLAFETVPREQFVLKENKDKAYLDVPLPILCGKTISQPTTVMLMTSALELEPGMKVFEVGAGSGYQTAIIAKLVGEKGTVVTSEIIPELVSFAKENLRQAQVENAIVIEDDGSRGNTEHAPYDRIIITSASKEFPPALVDQLKPGGIIVGPVGNAEEQEMVKGVKDRDGKLSIDFLGQFLFSPMYGKYGFETSE